MRNLVFVVFILLTFLSHFGVSLAYEKEIKSLSAGISESIIKSGKKTVAVVDFTDLQGNITELGRFIAEELSVDLTIKAQGFSVIDRTHLRSILAEHRLSMSGLVDPKTVKKLGQIAGVDAILTGSVTPFGDSIRVSCKAIATDTARVIGATKGDIPRTKAIEELLARGIETKVEATAPVRPAPTKAQQRVEAKGFLFELQSCKLSGGNIQCSLLVTNKAEDRDLEVYTDYWAVSRTQIFDNFGNKYVVDRAGVQIANIRSSGTSVSAKLISGVPARMILNFSGVSPEATSVALLEISCESKERFIAKLRNIPLSR